MKNLSLIIFLLIAIYSCQSLTKKAEQIDSTQAKLEKKDSIQPYVPYVVDSATIAGLTPDWGYRFVITGDFDGDGRTDTLTEHFTSGRTHKETFKYYEGIGYDTLITIHCNYIDPSSFISCNRKNIDTIFIGSGCQILGVDFLRNEGDLNGDGTDEISYVPGWGDWSSTNTCHLMTFKNNKWVELYSIPMWEWQIPPLPGTNTQYGLFGAQALVTIKDDTLNQRLEKEFEEFPGFLKKTGKNKIQIYYRNFEASMDTAIVDLRKPKTVDEIDKEKYKEFYQE